MYSLGDLEEQNDLRTPYDDFDVDFGIRFDAVIDVIPISSTLWGLLGIIDTAYFIICRGKLYSTRINTPLTEHVGNVARSMIF
jgi:hypothetical protein